MSCSNSILHSVYASLLGTWLELHAEEDVLTLFFVLSLTFRKVENMSIFRLILFPNAHIKSLTETVGAGI